MKPGPHEEVLKDFCAVSPNCKDVGKLAEGSLEIKVPTRWTDEKQREESGQGSEEKRREKKRKSEGRRLKKIKNDQKRSKKIKSEQRRCRCVTRWGSRETPCFFQCFLWLQIPEK